MNTHKKTKANNNVKLKAKSSNTTLVGKKDAISRDSEIPGCKWLEEYRDCFDGRMKPVTDKFLDRISTELLEYAKTTTDHFRISYFFAMKNIPVQTVSDWKEKYKEFAGACRLARLILAIRKEDKYLNSAIVMNTMGRDDEEYNAWLKEQIKLKQDAEEQKNIVVRIEEISRDGKNESN